MTLTEEQTTCADITGYAFTELNHGGFRQQIFQRNSLLDHDKRLYKLSHYFKFDKIMILGLGGIGAWVAQWFARMSSTRYMILIDPDCIEESNLNRTPFTIFDIGDLKVRSVANMITSCNPSISVYPYNRLFDDTFMKEIDEMVTRPDWVMYIDNLLVIDCRDNYYNDYHLFDHRRFKNEATIIRSAYNGESVTIDFDPKHHPVMGRGGYTTQPSHVLPAALAGLLTVVCALNYESYSNSRSSGVIDTTNRYLFDNPLTFDCSRAIEYLFNGMMLYRLAASGDSESVNIIQKFRNGNYFATAQEGEVF